MPILNRSSRGRQESNNAYIDYQRAVALRHVLPLLHRLGVSTEGPLLDVGCGTGGFAIALAMAWKVPVHGIDLSAEEIASAREAAQTTGSEAYFEVADILRDPLPQGEFKLILLRDVIEHVRDVELTLRNLLPPLADGGCLYVTFPPWHGPYAGHQHNARCVLRFFPYLHAVAPRLFVKLLETYEPDRQDWLEDERQLVANRLSRCKFERAACDAGWKIRYRQTYLLRPAFLRMGLPVIRNGWLGRLPVIGECLTTACEYLLEPADRPIDTVASVESSTCSA